MTYVKLVTLCGCSRIMESPVPMPYPKFVVALPAKVSFVDDVDEKLLDTANVFPARRVFEMHGPRLDVGDGDVMWVYREVMSESRSD